MKTVPAMAYRPGKDTGTVVCVGEDEFLIQMVRQRLGDTLEAGGRLDDLEIEKLDWEDLEAQVMTPCILGKRLIVLPSKSNSKRGLAAWLQRMRGQEYRNVLLVILDDWDSKEKWASAYEEEIILCGKLPYKDLLGWVSQVARENGQRVEEDAAEYLVSECGHSVGLLTVELTKLLVYAETGNVTRPMVDLLTVERREKTGWDLARALADQDKQKTMDLMERIFEQEGEGHHQETGKKILDAVGAVLRRAMRTIWHFRVCRDVEKAIKQAGILDWQVQDTIKLVQMLGRKHLTDRIYDLLLEADEGVKSFGNGKVVISRLLAKLLN